MIRTAAPFAAMRSRVRQVHETSAPDVSSRRIECGMRAGAWGIYRAISRYLAKGVVSTPSGCKAMRPLIRSGLPAARSEAGGDCLVQLRGITDGDDAKRLLCGLPLYVMAIAVSERPRRQSELKQAKASDGAARRGCAPFN